MTGLPGWTRSGKTGLAKAGAGGVGGHGGVDFEGEGEVFSSGCRVDTGWGAVGYGVEEVFQFEAERFGAGKVELVEAEAG